MARRSQCSSAGDNPLDPNYLPPHYREEYRLAIDALVEDDLEGYYQFLQKADVVDFLSTSEIDFIQHSVQPPRQSSHPEQQFLDSGGDGSSDTYWPIHSDLDVPGLDLGWPQLHPFIGPTEVTTLVNPPEPDMPSIKEQARRLIKNAQQVIAIVMDMFTDVDMFADVLNAAMRNVAVYILLDEQKAHHFMNMVSNCRVNLQSIQFLRVRTVSGITYQCRSGKSFKGQMMDRFLLTDCRAVLSGNYSFMWSFEKLHRSMAHLFLGQLVTTFDEEFRILFAQSQPLQVDNVVVPVEDFGVSHQRQYPNEKDALYREPRRFLPQDVVVQPDEWVRHSYDERMDGDWRMVALKKQASLRGPGDVYRRHATLNQQPWMEPCFDQGPSRMPVMENPAHKRHSYAEGVPDRYSSPFLQQQGMPDPEIQGKYFQKGQPPFPGPGPDYGGYDKFWNKDYLPAEQYSEPGLPQEMQPADNFDPVLNYLSSTRNLDFDQSSEKLQPAADLAYKSSHPRRQGFGQPYACQVSPTPSNSADQKQFFPDPTADRKDPTVKRGLRNWRISSYLSTYENPGDDASLSVPPQTDAFEEPANPGPDAELPVLKIPNVREFKIPAVPRAVQMPSYVKTKTQEQPKKLLSEPAAAEAEIKTTPTPSESSTSTAERDKADPPEQKEPKTIGLLRDDSFKRKYNATVPRSSRLRSSLIFSSLEQQQAPQETTEQADEQGDNNESEQTKLPFVSRVLGQRRSAAREPFEWSQYAKSTTFDNSSTETSKLDNESGKGDDKESSKVECLKDISENPELKEPLKPKGVELDFPSPSVPQLKPAGAELPRAEQPVQPPAPLIKTPLYVDMSDPDNRLMFFKELAAKRKAAKATEAAKSKEKVQIKPSDNSTSKTEEPLPNVTSEGIKNAAAEALKPTSLPLDVCEKENTAVRDVCGKVSKVSADADTAELDNPSAAPETCQTTSPEAPMPARAPEKDSCDPPAAANVDISPLTQGTAESPKLDCASVLPGSVEVSPSPELDVIPVQLETSLDSLPGASELNRGTDTSVQSPSPPDPSSQTGPTSWAENIPADPSSSLAPDISFPIADKTEGQETASSSLQESSYSAKETSQTSAGPSSPTASDSLPRLTSPETPSAADSAHAASGISSDGNNAPDPEANTPSLRCEELPATTASSAGSEKSISELENDGSELNIRSDPEKSDTLGADRTLLSLSTGVSLIDKVDVSGLAPKFDPTETISPVTSPEDTPPQPGAGVSPGPAQSEASVPSEDMSTQATAAHDLNPTDAPTPPAETISCSAPPESDGTASVPESEKTETDKSASDSLSVCAETQQEPEDLNLTTEPSSDSPPDANLPCKTSESDTPGSHACDESSKTQPDAVDAGETTSPHVEDTNKSHKSSPRDSVSSEQRSDQVKQSSEPTDSVSKQPKSSPSRYHSSTANVLSSSNLRDDTKLLLEQISANCQSRNEATKESPVTDDEKEDEADKNAKKEKESGLRTLTMSRGPSKSPQEREKLLERIQSMRKERKVYSRFEMAP